MRKIVLTALLMVVGAMSLVAQNMPERGDIRRGNRLFDKEKWEEAAQKYTEAITHSPSSFEANYNLSNALHKAQDFAKAQEIMTKVAADSLLDSQSRADAYYNLGNSQFYQQQYEEALESYKSSMRLNHADTMAKYNYAYTKLMLQQQQQQEQEQNQDNQEQNKDNQGEQNQEQQEQNQDNQEQQDKDNQGEQDKDNQGENPQPQDGELSEQQRDQILDAIQAQEDKTQEKLDKEKGRAILIPNAKNW